MEKPVKEPGIFDNKYFRTRHWHYMYPAYFFVGAG